MASESSYESTISTSTTTATDDSNSTVYAIVIPMLVWLAAVFCCYPITFIFYRYCMRIRIGKSPEDPSSESHRICCCHLSVAARRSDTDNAQNTDQSQAAATDGQSSSRRRRAENGGSPASAAPPPAYDVALGMPKPTVGDVVRFQNTVDGGWCTFTFTTYDDDAVCEPPAYAFADDDDDDDDEQTHRQSGTPMDENDDDVLYVDRIPISEPAAPATAASSDSVGLNQVVVIP